MLISLLITILSQCHSWEVAESFIRADLCISLQSNFAMEYLYTWINLTGMCVYCSNEIMPRTIREVVNQFHWILLVMHTDTAIYQVLFLGVKKVCKPVDNTPKWQVRREIMKSKHLSGSASKIDFRFNKCHSKLQNEHGFAYFCGCHCRFVLRS